MGDLDDDDIEYVENDKAILEELEATMNGLVNAVEEAGGDMNQGKA